MIDLAAVQKFQGVPRTELENRIRALCAEVAGLRESDVGVLHSNLTAVQKRCTELFEEARHLRGIGEMAAVFRWIRKERARQNAKWGRREGEWTDDDGLKLAVLGEEYGEVARALLEDDDRPHGSLGDSRDAHLRAELTEVAAVCVSWLETFVSVEQSQGAE